MVIVDSKFCLRLFSSTQILFNSKHLCIGTELEYFELVETTVLKTKHCVSVEKINLDGSLNSL